MECMSKQCVLELPLWELWHAAFCFILLSVNRIEIQIFYLS